MARKYEMITELYRQSLQEITSRPESWTAFLRSACRNYRLPFDEQVLVHAQRPDAVAVLEIEGENGWNKRFGRWVNRGAKGIAVFDREYTHGTRLKYYFDISDTHESRFARPVPLWEMHPAYEADIIESLENSFGELESKENLAAALLSTAKNAVEDNMPDYLADLLLSRENSFLEELDDFNVEVAYRDALQTSVAYMLMTRCGIDADEYLFREDFSNLLNFNTPETVNALGTAASDIAEMGLSEIARTVRNLQKTEKRQNRTFAEKPKVQYPDTANRMKQPERSLEYGTDIRNAGRLQPTESDRAGRAGSNLWEIRPAAPGISEAAPQGAVHESSDLGQADGTPDGNRGSRTEPHGADRDGAGESRGRDGGTESPRPDDVGRPDEQLPTRGGGDYPQGTDNQLTLLPSAEEQQNTIEAEAATKVAEKASAFAISQEDIDAVLQGGSGVENGKYRIYEQFQRSLSQSENAAFLKREYGIGGRLDEAHDGKGIAISRGRISSPDARFILPWNKAAERIAELIKLDRYLSDKEKAHYPAYLEQAEERRLQAVEAAAAREVLSRAPQDVVPAKRENARYEYHLGNTVYLGAEEYEILAFDENEVRLFDVSFPLINKVLTRAEFDAKVRENPLNDHLLATGEPEPADDGPNYDLMYGHLGNGVTVWNRLVEEHGDYKTVAHISPERQVTFYDDVLPQALREKIEQFARTSDMRISTSQDTPVFHTPPVAAESEMEEEAEIGLAEVMQTEQSSRADKMLRQAEQIAADSMVESEERFFVIETDDGYAVWDDAREEIYVDDEGVSEEFTSRWQAESYLETVKKAAADKTAQATAEVETIARYVCKDERIVIQRYPNGQYYNRYGYDEQTGNSNSTAGGFATLDEAKETLFAHRPLAELDPQHLREKAQPPEEAVPQEPVSGTPETVKLRSIVIDLTAPAREKDLPAKKEETLAPPPVRREKASPFVLHPEIPTNQRHNFQITDDYLGEGGAKTKFKNNAAAIRTLQEIEFDNRLATPEEQETLSRYVGWGGLPQAFDEGKEDWANEFIELQTLLSPEEYEAAKATTLNAHYTSPAVIKAIYQAVENMGFRTGNVLEPSCGIGNFFGLVPESMKDSKLFGVELDSITGRIARQLYQQNSIAVQGFEETELPDSFFDLAVGNVPFGSYSVYDKKYNKHRFLIHDYFFARTLDKVRPGGIVAFVTSKGTMDKKNLDVRKYIAQRAELIGAIRLPNNAFLANAGTQVTTDIIFLQKREKLIDVDMSDAGGNLPFAESDGRELPAGAARWLHLGQTKNGVPINQYYLDHPEMVLGEMAFDDMMYGNAKETTCKPFEGASLSDLLAEAVQNLHAEYTDYEIEELDGEGEDKSIPADPDVRNFSYTLVNGAIYYRENSRMFPVEQSLTGQSRVKGMIAIRDCVRRLIEYQTESAPDETVEREQRNLNRLYDSFTAKYGLLNSRANTTAFSPDSSFPLLCSLEILDENGNLERKADMFRKRTIMPYIAVSKVDTASEALAVSIGEKACVDLGFMASLMGGSEKIEQIKQDLTGVIFKDPDSGDDPLAGWQTADEYLSGRVRDKLKRARQAAEHNPNYAVNVAALEKVQPQDLTAGEISVRLGTTWIPEDVIEDFTFELLGTPWNYERRIKIRYSKVTGEWNVSEKSLDRSNIKAYNTYGTKRINAYKIIEDTLNLRDVRIFDTQYDADGREKRVLNKKETAIAQDKQEAIKQKFQEWIWAEPSRRDRLCRIYNQRFNSIRPREYDGSHIVFAGMNPAKKLRVHQRNAVARAIYGGNALFGHVVGAGKTYEMIATAMEAKRLGLSNKSLFVVPNNIIGDFAADFLDLYPSANILMATKKDFEKQNRKKFCARIATGDYDGIIIGHSQFEKIPLSAERQENMLRKQISEVVAGIAAAKAEEGSRFTVKQMEKSKKSLEAKLKKLTDQSRKDDVVTFEELGVDRLFIDEADMFKNLYLYTKMRNVGGIAQTEALKASDLFMKCRYLDELTGNKGVVFETGTPVSNSMAEMYTMQRYLQYDALERMELTHFDSWAAQFGETVTSMELKPEGTGFQQKTRFSNFYNLPELMAMFKEVADIQTADMLKLPVPKANYHTVVCKPSDMQKDMVSALADRADKVRNGSVDPSVDNMLLITNDGRKLALDQRLVNPMLPDFEDSKVNICAGNVYKIWEDTKEQRLTQLVFCDLSTPKNDGTFSVYDDLREKLVERGIPEEEIAFVHEATNEVQKKELFAKVRKGAVRVLLGSTFKMGAGTNVQDRLIALHDLDCPWRPRDLEQRLGRIVRQKNKNPEVEIFRYVTEGTFDSYLYQMVENKQRFISQVFTSKSPARVMQEIDDTALSYAEIKALATGNPLIIEHANLGTEVNKLKMLNASHLSQKYELEDKILKHFPQEISRLGERISGYTADITRRDGNAPAKKEDFPPMKIHDTVYTEKAEAGKALIEACKKLTNSDPVSIGAYRGFEMLLFYEAFAKEYRVSLKGTLSHTVALGTDIHGNITRLDNALNGMETRLQECRERLENTKGQMEAAKVEAEKPFPRAEELREKSKRLAELTKLLKMDEKDRELLDSSPDEGDEPPERKVAGLER